MHAYSNPWLECCARAVPRPCAALAVALAVAFPAVVEAQPGFATRYVCTLPDGSARLFAQDLGATFAMSVGACKAVAMRQLGEPPDSLPAVVPETIEVRIIVAPASAQLPAAARFAVASPPEALASWVDAISRRHGLDPALASAVMYVESRYRADAVSPKGAIGLMQIMPATGSRYGVASASKLFDPKTNIEVGVRYLRDLLAMFQGRLDLALAAYNAGEGAVVRHGGQIPPYTETRLYVEQVLGRLSRADAQ